MDGFSSCDIVASLWIECIINVVFWALLLVPIILVVFDVVVLMLP